MCCSCSPVSPVSNTNAYFRKGFQRGSLGARLECFVIVRRASPRDIFLVDTAQYRNRSFDTEWSRFRRSGSMRRDAQHAPRNQRANSQGTSADCVLSQPPWQQQSPAAIFTPNIVMPVMSAPTPIAITRRRGESACQRRRAAWDARPRMLCGRSIQEGYGNLWPSAYYV